METLLNPQTGEQVPARDMREEFARITQNQPKDIEAERAFLKSKLKLADILLNSQPADEENEIKKLQFMLNQYPSEEKNDDKTPPVPGGVGYGAFYNADFKSLYETGTILAVDIVAPTKPGGNVGTYLYLTATNRTAKGVEAFISYYDQNDLTFKVFDWSREDKWQTSIPASAMGDYLLQKIACERECQVISLQNQTFVKSGNTWTNLVYLYNHNVKTFDLIYSYDYTASESEQKSAWVGSWGPIVETFQDSYSNTNPLGFSYTYLMGRDKNNQWSNFAVLSDNQSYIRNDNKGFRKIFFVPNHSFLVD